MLQDSVFPPCRQEAPEGQHGDEEVQHPGGPQEHQARGGGENKSGNMSVGRKLRNVFLTGEGAPSGRPVHPQGGGEQGGVGGRQVTEGQTELLKLFLMIPPSLGRYSADPRGQSRPSTRGPRPRETYEEIRNALTLLGNQVLSEYRSSTICL